MQEPELYSRNCCSKINSINAYADFATIYAELKHVWPWVQTPANLFAFYLMYLLWFYSIHFDWVAFVFAQTPKYFRGRSNIYINVSLLLLLLLPVSVGSGSGLENFPRC